MPLRRTMATAVSSRPAATGLYSARNAVIGSTRSARSVGAKRASTVIRNAERDGSGERRGPSAGLTPASSASMLRPAAYASSTPGTIPAIARDRAAPHDHRQDVARLRAERQTDTDLPARVETPRTTAGRGCRSRPARTQSARTRPARAPASIATRYRARRSSVMRVAPRRPASSDRPPHDRADRCREALRRHASIAQRVPAARSRGSRAIADLRRGQVLCGAASLSSPRMRMSPTTPTTVRS